MPIKGELYWDSSTGVTWIHNGSTWVELEDKLKLLLLRDLPEKYRMAFIEIEKEEDFLRVYYDGMLIRQIDPLYNKRMICYFENNPFIEFTREELEILLKEMYRQYSTYLAYDRSAQ